MTPQPTFDSAGAPTDETLRTIRDWPHPFDGLIDYVRAAWRHDYGRMWKEGGCIKMATGGWSANEQIAAALRRNAAFYAFRWQSSHRGGLEVFNDEAQARRT